MARPRFRACSGVCSAPAPAAGQPARDATCRFERRTAARSCGGAGRRVPRADTARAALRRGAASPDSSAARGSALPSAARPYRLVFGRQPLLCARDRSRTPWRRRRAVRRRAACRSPNGCTSSSRHASPRFRSGRATCCSRSRCSRASSASALAATFDSPQEMEAALAEAVDADVIVRDEAGVRFTHPLLASAVYASASETRRHRMRRRLADIVSDPEERARHAAHAATAPDEATALEVERAAELALRRGAQDAAADLYQAAARLTPPERPSDASRRLLGASRATLAVGDPSGARGLADSALACATDATDIRRGAIAAGPDRMGGEPRPAADRAPGTRTRIRTAKTAGSGAAFTRAGRVLT